MIEAYGGFVRCGNCDYKFNVHDQVRLDNDYFHLSHEDVLNEDSQPLVSGFDSPGHSDRVEPKLDASSDDDELNIRFRPDEYEFEEDMPDGPGGVPEKLEPRFEFPSLEETESNSVAEQSVAETDQLPEMPDIAPPRTESQPEARPQLEPASLAGDDIEQTINVADTADDDEFDSDTLLDDGPVNDEPAAGDRPHSPVPQAPEVDLDEFDEVENWEDDSDGRIEPRPPVFGHTEFDDDIELDGHRLEPSLSAPSLINDDAEESDDQPGVMALIFSAIGRFIAFSFWLILALALAYLLFGQIRDRVYPAYKQNPTVQKIRTGICGFVPCVDAKYDVSQYEIVVSRMDELRVPERQLQVSIFLLNKAPHAQPYPNLLLTLKRMDGSIAGRRVLTPDDYTTSHSSLISTGSVASKVTKMLIKPNKLGKILIKFDRPPEDAVGFEARVAP